MRQAHLIDVPCRASQPALCLLSGILQAPYPTARAFIPPHMLMCARTHARRFVGVACTAEMSTSGHLVGNLPTLAMGQPVQCLNVSEWGIGDLCCRRGWCRQELGCASRESRPTKIIASIVVRRELLCRQAAAASKGAPLLFHTVDAKVPRGKAQG